MKYVRGQQQDAFAVNFEHISHLCLVSIIEFEEVNVGWNIQKNFNVNFKQVNHINLLLFPAGIYLFNVKNRNTRTRREIRSKLTIWRNYKTSGVVLVSLLLILNIFHILFCFYC